MAGVTLSVYIDEDSYDEIRRSCRKDYGGCNPSIWIRDAALEKLKSLEAKKVTVKA